MKPRFGRRWRGSEAGRHEGGKYLAGTSRKGKPTSGLEPPTYSLRVNCSYRTIICFILLDNRSYQRERRSVMRCNEGLLIEIRVLRLQSVAILLHKAEDVRPVSLLFSTSASSFTSPYGNNRESRKVCDGVRDSAISSEPTPYPYCALPTQRLTVEMPIPKVRSIRANFALAAS